MSTTPSFLSPAGTRRLLHGLALSWWLILVRGLLAILFGALAFAWPGIALITIVLLFGAFALVDSMVVTITAIAQKGKPWPNWWLALVGLTGVAAGEVTFLWPQVSPVVLALLIGAWATARGIFEMIGFLQLRKEMSNEWWLATGGLLSVCFGFVMVLAPGPNALGLAWAIAGYSIAVGVIWVGFAFRLRRHHRLGIA